MNSFEEILQISNSLKKCCEDIRTVIIGKGSTDLEDFVSAVDTYTKYLDNSVELNQDADKALQELINSKK